MDQQEDDGLGLANKTTHARKRRKPSQQRTYNCLPCRRFKLKCNRRAPCESCIRHGRQDECLQNPPLSLQAAAESPYRLSSSSGHVTALDALLTNGPTPPVGRPPTPQVLDWPGDGAGYDDAATRQMVEPDGQQQQRPAMPARAPFVPTLRAQLRAENDAATRTLLQQLLEQLPTQSQCDVLVSFYAQHMNWVYAVVNLPAFRRQYNQFWLSPDETNLGSLALLNAILCVGAVYVPPKVFTVLDFDASNVDLAEAWYFLSRQCLFAAGCESRPTLIQIQTFIITQLYWHGTNDPETLYSCLGQAICAAQLLKLDQDSTDEWRRRLWSEICTADVSQSIHLGCRSLTQAYKSSVSLPENRVNHNRARIVKLLSEATEATFQNVSRIDKQLLELEIVDGEEWERHLLHSSLHAHRIRMWSRYLTTSLPACVSAAHRCFELYRHLDRASPKMRVQSWGNMGTAMILGVLLLVERSPNIREDLEMILGDLDKCVIPVTTSGTRVLRKLLDMHDHTTEEETDLVVGQVYSLCGGRESVRDWLQRRCPTYYSQFNAEGFLELEDLNFPLWLSA